MTSLTVWDRTALSPEGDRWFDEAFADLVSGDGELVRAEFDALIASCWWPPPAVAPAPATPSRSTHRHRHRHRRPRCRSGHQGGEVMVSPLKAVNDHRRCGDTRGVPVPSAATRYGRRGRKPDQQEHLHDYRHIAGRPQRLRHRPRPVTGAGRARRQRPPNQLRLGGFASPVTESTPAQTVGG